MKNILLYSALCVACGGVHAQSASSVQTATTSSAAQSGAMAVGGGLATSVSGGGAGGAGGNGAGGAASSNVTVNLGSTDPSSGSNAQPVSNAQQTAAGDPTTRIKEDIKTVGNPGAVSYGVSFSQFNCANTAAVGAGWLGGVFQLGGGLESSPCNDRANASALFQIAGALAPSNGQLSSQLYHAAILLIGNSTKETKAALAQAGVADWVTPINPPPPDVASTATSRAPDDNDATYTRH